MALSQRKRQQKLEKRRAKQRAKQRPLATQNAVGAAGRISQAAHYPILDSYVQDSIWELGIGQVLLSRQGPGGIAFASFLVDVYCLGVKDAMANIASPSDYDEKVVKPLAGRHSFIAKPPAYVRKLVEDAVQFARQLGLTPHPDYRVARQIFGDIDPTECHDSFSFGRDGKPCFISGPYDGPERCREIMSILQFERGSDGGGFLTGAADVEDDLAEIVDSRSAD